MNGNEIILTCTVTCDDCGMTLSEEGRHIRPDFPDYRGWVYDYADSEHSTFRAYLCPRCAAPPAVKN